MTQPGKYAYAYPKADITVDCVLFGFNPEASRLEVVLIRRGDEPYKGRWALPGGFIELAHDTQVVWDPTNPDEIADAQSRFEAMLAAGGTAFRMGASVEGEAVRGERLESFAPELGQMILRNATETAAEAARREMQEETGVTIDYLEQLMTFDAPDRDPRGRVFAVAHYALVRSKDHTTTSGSDATEALWMTVKAALTLPADQVAFDHKLILKTAVDRLQAKVRYAPIGFNLLPKKFTLGQLQKLYEAILFRELDKRNFRKRFLAMGLLEEAGTEKSARSGPPAKLYRFDKRAYDRAVRDGFNFEI